MGRIYEGLYRVMVKFEHPDGGVGWDFTATPDAYDECAKLCVVLGWGYPWEVVVDGRARQVRVNSALIVGPVDE